MIHARLALMALAEALALAGRPAEAAEALTKLESYSSTVARILDAEVTRAGAWVAVGAGDFVRAKQLLEKAAAVASRSGDPAFEAAAWHDLARLGEPARALPRLAGLAERMEGALPANRAAHVRALLSRDPGELLAVADGFEEMGAHLVAAEAAAAIKRDGNARRANAADRLAGTLG